MKTLGLIGGTTWVSTQDYYKHINKEVNQMLGGHHAGRLILYSFNFHELVTLQEKKDYDNIRILIVDAAKRIAGTGVDGIMLCANTLHKYAGDVIAATGLPLIHIADETAKEIRKAGFTRVGLLGTRTTMGETFYKDRLKSHGIETYVPSLDDQEYINRAIFDEMAKDIFEDATRREHIRIMEELQSRGTQGIILGCTEIPLLITPEHTAIPTFDTLVIHARAGARFIAESD